MHREPDGGFDPGSPGSRPGPKAGAKPLYHPGIPPFLILIGSTWGCFVGSGEEHHSGDTFKGVSWVWTPLRELIEKGISGDWQAGRGS